MPRGRKAVAENAAEQKEAKPKIVRTPAEIKQHKIEVAQRRVDEIEAKIQKQKDLTEALRLAKRKLEWVQSMPVDGEEPEGPTSEGYDAATGEPYYSDSGEDTDSGPDNPDYPDEYYDVQDDRPAEEAVPAPA